MKKKKELKTIREMQNEIVKLSREIKSQRGDVVQGVGIVIRTLRQELGYTQAELATMIGVTRTSIVKIEGGKNLFSIPTLILMCDILKTTPDVLLGYLEIPKAAKKL